MILKTGGIILTMLGHWKSTFVRGREMLSFDISGALYISFNS